MAQAQLDNQPSFSIGTITGLRDFFPKILSANLSRNGHTPKRIVHLPHPERSPRRDLYATDISAWFEDPVSLENIARLWKPHLSGIEVLGLPAVFGIHRSYQTFMRMQDLLAVRIFEIPTPPPSLPGLRLESVLNRTATKSGVDIILGSPAVGRTRKRSDHHYVSGITLHTAGGERKLTARSVILASGGFLHGGLIAHQNGSVQEAVFNLPVDHIDERQNWTCPSPMEGQPFSQFGIRVNSQMQPIGANSQPVYQNLFAAGGIIAGADRQQEGSRQGIDLASALRAVEAALE